VANGIAVYDGELFKPNEDITRQEMALVMLNYAVYKGYDIPVNRAALNFSDSGQIADWAQAAVKSMSEAGVLSGSSGAFRPSATATRAEVAQTFKNFIRFIV